MKTIFYNPICFLIILFLIISSGCSKPEELPLQGEKAPDFTLDLLGGGTTSLADLSGKPILLEFLAPWCPGCLANIDPVKELYASFADRVHIIAPIIERDRKVAEAFIGKHKISYPVVFTTGSFLEDYKINTIPVTIIIDGDGMIRHHHLGTISTKNISEKLESLL
jgi:peroxiredoxin